MAEAGDPSLAPLLVEKTASSGTKTLYNPNYTGYSQGTFWREHFSHHPFARRNISCMENLAIPCKDIPRDSELGCLAGIRDWEYGCLAGTES